MTGHLHMKLAPHALLYNHAADFAVEIAKDVVQIRAPSIGGNGSRSALEFRRGEYGSTATITRWSQRAL
jgi:hypothetical protein